MKINIREIRIWISLYSKFGHLYYIRFNVYQKLLYTKLTKLNVKAYKYFNTKTVEGTN